MEITEAKVGSIARIDLSGSAAYIAEVAGSSYQADAWKKITEMSRKVKGSPDDGELVVIVSVLPAPESSLDKVGTAMVMHHGQMHTVTLRDLVAI